MPTPTAWCTIADIEDIMSVESVVWATDDERDGVANELNSTNAIERARLWFMERLGKYYTSDSIAGSSWGKWACARRAAIELMRRRGETVPVGLLTWLTEMEDYLRLVMSGAAIIPEVNKLNEYGSVGWNNVTHDQRSQRKQIRRVDDTSSEPPNTNLPIPGLIRPSPDYLY